MNSLSSLRASAAPSFQLQSNPPCPASHQSRTGASLFGLGLFPLSDCF